MAMRKRLFIFDCLSSSLCNVDKKKRFGRNLEFVTLARNEFGAIPALAVRVVRWQIFVLSSETTSPAIMSKFPKERWASR